MPLSLKPRDVTVIQAAAKANPRCVVALVAGVLFGDVNPSGKMPLTTPKDEKQVDVTNTGSRAGEEVVQLYVGFEASRVDRPVKLLSACAMTALAPGETKTVPLSVAVKDLAWSTRRRRPGRSSR